MRLMCCLPRVCTTCYLTICVVGKLVIVSHSLLLVSDKLKSCLPTRSLNYVLSLEGNDWFEPSMVASLADTFTTNHESLNIRGPQTQHPRQPGFPQPRQFVPPRARAPAPSRWYSGSYQGRPENNSAGRGRRQSHPLNKCCFVCNSPAHFAKDCPCLLYTSPSPRD